MESHTHMLLLKSSYSTSHEILHRFTSEASGNAAWIVYRFCPHCLYFLPPPLSFVFCLWSDFIPYATELFGPVGR